MPKITVHGGPSVAGASVVGGSWSSEGDPDVWPKPADEEGAEQSSEDVAAPEPEAAAEEPEKAPRQRRTRSK